ncbi:hypothetical protein EMCG_06943 [[Emmonsia] crescens]|uniref:Uncharacterized protein n=1 Tax=[Emmonsia] crescens TaxID=73230 RepID=A0A0G2IAY8_9EURO|nr:hypothetical protein EMCG_06943 [Emmonsia crescens UAMH 3008]
MSAKVLVTYSVLEVEKVQKLLKLFKFMSKLEVDIGYAAKLKVVYSGFKANQALEIDSNEICSTI